jgi:prepilin-type processing-associated H-X9-DG protein
VPKHISGVFARSSWAARIRDIKDGTSHTIAMGEIRPRGSAFMWARGWTLSEGLWFATTAPLNHNTLPLGSNVAPRIPRCGDWERDFNSAMGFKSAHDGGVNFVLCDGSAHFLSNDVSHTVYQQLGARRDGETVSVFQ